MAKSENINNDIKTISMKISKKKPVSTKAAKKSDSNKPIRSINAEVKAKKAKNTSIDAIPTKATIALDKNDIVPNMDVKNKVKKTIKLNLENIKPREIKDKNITTKITYVKDNSVNQNSPFFYKPSIFEKFNIDVVDTDIIDADPLTDSFNEIENNEQEKIDTNDIIINNSNENIDDSFDMSEIVELDTSAINCEVETPSINDEHQSIDSSSIFTEIKNESANSNEDFIDRKLSKEELVKANSEIIEEMLESIKNETNINSNIVNISDDSSIEEKQVADNGPVGKFFDSSISPITSHTQDFHSITKPKSNTGSFIFKNFTFEEASLFNNSLENDEFINPVDLNNVNNSNFDNSTSLLSSLNNEINIDESAKVNTIEEPLVNVDVIQDSSSETNENKEEINLSKIITPDTSSIDNIELEDIDLDNITLEDSTSSDSQIENNSEIFSDDTSDLFDEISIDNISLDDISIDDIELTENDIENLEENLKDINIDEGSEESSVESINSDISDEPLEENLFETFIKQENEEEINNAVDKEIDEIVSKKDDETTEVDDSIYDDITNDDLEELEDTLNDYDDNSFSIEKYFGIDNNEEESENSIEEKDSTINNTVDNDSKLDEQPLLEDSTDLSDSSNINENENNDSVLPDVDQIGEFTNPDILNLSTLIKNFTQTISTLNTRIADLETGKIPVTDITKKEENINNEETDTVAPTDESNLNNNLEEDNNITSNDAIETEIEIENNTTESNLEDLSNEIIDDNNDIDESLLLDASLDDLIDQDIINDEDIESSLLEDVLSEQIDENLVVENDVDLFPTLADSTDEITDASSDFFKILDTLSKTISQLEETPDESAEFTPHKEIVIETVKEENQDLPQELLNNEPIEEGKEINILINKDDIFSIQILNETYEIVADFDGISVISENIHISTPKNNFYVKVGEKYIEIHNQKSQYLVTTNFEDIEFANAINNVGFAKKNNKIELNIKEAFKLSSINNKIELSMLNSPIADLSAIAKPESEETKQVEDNSICDNRTLLISEETQKVYLPYTIDEVMKKLNESTEYQTVDEVIAKEYTLPLSTFKVPVVSRFKEAYKFMREKEKSSRYAAMDLGMELMFNSNLNPAIIRAAKDLKELNIYLDCLYENEVDKFNCFKIIYKVLPKIQ